METVGFQYNNLLARYLAACCEELHFAGVAAEGFVISSSQPEERSDAIEAFERKYQELYGELPDVLARNAYDAIRLQVAAFIECDGNSDCMASWLHNIKDYVGVSGKITIQEDGSTKKPTIFKIVKNGMFVPLEL